MKFSGFFPVKATIYLLLHDFLDCTFNPLLRSVVKWLDTL